MKKILLTTIAALLAIALNAQVSVWDGTAEPWTHGSGTPDDPYLIENAQQLAYLAEKTNETMYGYHGNMYVDTCFLLTTDLDLGADNGLLWVPIGAQGATVGLGTRSFGGRFDGGNHKVFNINYAYNVLYYGLFGNVVDGEIKNMIIDDDEIVVPSLSPYTMYGQRGLLIGLGHNVYVQNCINNSKVVMNNIDMHFTETAIGGLFGKMTNSNIIDCYNNGDLTILDVSTSYYNIYFGGVAGVLENCSIVRCSNNGNLQINRCDMYNGDILATGGITGMMTGEINSCYCVADVNTNGSVNVNFICSGGIVGHVPDSSELTISDCYYAGEIISNHIGGIVGLDNGTVSVENCYYVETVESGNSYGIPKSVPEMQSPEFVNLLNNGSNNYDIDDMNVNDGYPVFADHYAIAEHLINNYTVYPNPANSVIYISAPHSGYNIINTLGQIVMSGVIQSDNQPIDISGLPDGVYFLSIPDGTIKFIINN